MVQTFHHELLYFSFLLDVLQKSLMLHFGSLQKLKKANLSEIRSVENITDKIANKIYDFFHS